MTRREERIALRRDRSGSGPTVEHRAPQRFPGATGAFALFGEVLVTGVLVAIVGLLVVTLPAGLAAGIRHMRRYAAAEDSRVRFFWADVKRALLPGSVVGAAATALVLLLVLDIDLARSGFLPGGLIVEVVGWAGLAAVGASVLAAAGAWAPETGWRVAVCALPRTLVRDVRGTLLLVATAGLVVVLTWTLPPLIVPALGCAALAVVAIPERRRRTR